MKEWLKKSAKLLLVVSLLTAGMAFAACNSEDSGDSSSDDTGTSVPEVVYEVDLSMNEWTMNVYEDIILNAIATQNDETIDSTIVWTSSDTSIATVDNGKVNALKAGTVTITASANGVSDTCVITVLNTAGAPQVIIDANEVLQVRVGDNFQVEPTLIYNDNTYTDATFTYSSANNEIFTVNETGLITAVEEGEADLTVSASWHGLSGTDLTEVIRVKVIEDIAIELSNTEVTTIYTTNKDFGNGETYITTVTYGASIYYNGTLVDDTTTSTWLSSNTDVATVDARTGVVTATGVGETAITLSYVSQSGATYVSDEIILTVSLPSIEKDIEIAMGASDTTNPLSGDEIFGEGETQTIVSITDVTGGISETIAYAEGNVTADLEEGERQWMISNGEYGYIVDVIVATNAIRKAEDLRIFDYTDKNNSFRGTYVLANNIDASSYTHYANVGWSNSFTGLTGTFDGRGYTIDGITLRQGGLFGVIYGGTVKNVAFTNVTLSDVGDTAGTTLNNVYVLATRARKNATVSDLFVSIKAWPTNANTTTAALMSQTDENAASFSNVMIVTPATNLTNARAVFATRDAVATFSNIYVISSVKGFYTLDTVDGVVKHATTSDFATNVDVSELTFGDIWDLTGDYPIFKTSEKPDETPDDTPNENPDEPLDITVTETGKEIVFGAADTKNPLIVSQFTDNTEFSPTAIVNVADNTEIAYDAMTKNVTATLTEGKYEWIIHNGEYGYKVNVWVATNVIREANDLQLFDFTVATNTFSGTYVLANDIDASEYTHYMQKGWVNNQTGLTGTFDGRGYTIDGITLRQGGLFGVLTKGEVLNVAFTNVKFSAADDNGGTTGNHLYVLATLAWYSDTKIDNVFIEIDSWAETASKTTAVLFHSVKKATPSISNVVIITPAATGNETKVEPVVCSAANATFANVYVISPVTGTAITGVTQYNDVATFKQNVTTSTLTGFNEYWDLTGDYPIFKTAK